MKKRILALALAVCMLAALLPQAALTARAARSDTDVPYAVEGGNLYFDKAAGAITDCDKSVTRAEIPAKIDGVPVTTIAQFAFEDCNRLTGIAIPDGVTTIGVYAFSDCSSLTNFTIPNSVTIVGYGAFSGCTGLTSVTIGSSVITIDAYTFSDCSSLTAITVAAGNPNYCSKDGVLFSKDGTQLRCCPGGKSGSYTISDSVTSIGDDAFWHCTSLTSVIIPNSVTAIGDGAFGGCTGLTSVTIPDSVTVVGYGAFSGCTGLTSATIGNSVTVIDKQVFSECTSLTSVTIGNSVTTIDLHAFGYCTSLTSITIPDSVTSIGKSAFARCYSLTSVAIPDSVATIDDGAFDSCENLTAVYFSGNTPEMGKDVFSLTKWSNDEGNLVLVPNPKLTIYYVEGKEGWASPTWYGYPTATWDGVSVPTPAKEFTDVKPGAWYYNAVNFATTHNLFNGTSNTTFSPSQSMTRGMLVTVLWRLAGEPAPKAAATFSDVEAGRYFTNAVAWASENGIVNGMGNNLFKPNNDVTREQAATFLYRYAQYKGYDTTARADLSQFPDADQVSNFAKDSLSWANAKGLINGKKNTATGVISLAPKGNATRAELATILMNFVQNVEA